MNRRSYPVRPTRMVVVLAVLAVFSQPVGAVAQAIQPLPPGGTYYSLTMADWAVALFQWKYSIPRSLDTNALVDETGERAGIGQRSPVWFLPVFDIGTATRTYTVPEGQAVLAVVAWTMFHARPGTATENELLSRGVDHAFLDRVSPTVKLDGVTIPNLKRYRVVTPVFSVVLPPDNLLDIPVTSGEDARVAMVGAGHFLLFPPLPAGKHIYTLKDTSYGVSYTIHLIVQKPNEPLP